MEKLYNNNHNCFINFVFQFHPPLRVFFFSFFSQLFIISLFISSISFNFTPPPPKSKRLMKQKLRINNCDTRRLRMHFHPPPKYMYQTSPHAGVMGCSAAGDWPCQPTELIWAFCFITFVFQFHTPPQICAKKLSKLDIETILPAHGLIWNNPGPIVEVCAYN